LRRRARAFALLLLALGCTLASPVHADEVAPLGATGQWLLGGSAGGTYESRTVRDEPGPPTFHAIDHASLWIAPSLLHFVATDFAVGLSLLVGHDHYDRSDGLETEEFFVGGGARIAYRGGLAPAVFLLPTLSAGAMRLERSITSPSRVSIPFERFSWVPLASAMAEALIADVTGLHATLSVPLAFSPAAGLVLGVGPYVRARYALSGMLSPGARDWDVSLGLDSTIAIWL